MSRIFAEEPALGSGWLDDPLNGKRPKSSGYSKAPETKIKALRRVLGAVAHHPLMPLSMISFATLFLWLAVYVLFISSTLWDTPSLVDQAWPTVFGSFQLTFNNIFGWDAFAGDRTSFDGVQNVLIWVGLSFLLSFFWLLATRAALRLPDSERLGRLTFRLVIGGLIIFSLLQVFSLGYTSNDIFSYIWYGKIAGIFHMSPFTHAPSYFANQDPDGWLRWVYWRDQTAVYGPVWLMPATLLTWLAQLFGGQMFPNLFIYRVFAAVLHIVNAVLVWNIAGRLIPLVWSRFGKPSPGSLLGAKVAATLFYAWCPLLIWEFANNGHNDVWMVTWILLAIFAHLKGVERAENGAGLGRWWMLAVACFAMAALVKVIAVLFVPAYMMMLFGGGNWRGDWLRRIKLSAQAAAIMLALAVVFYAPYWEGPKTVTAIIDAPGNKSASNSIGFVLTTQLPLIVHNGAVAIGLTTDPTPATSQRIGQAVPQEATPDPEAAPWTADWIANQINGPLRSFLLLTSFGLIIFLTLRVNDLQSLFNNWGWLMMAYLAIGAVWFWPWYVAWLIPIVALKGPGKLWNLTALYSWGAMLLYCFHAPQS